MVLFLFNINHILINDFSSTNGLISFFFRLIFPYPGNDFTLMLLLFSILFAWFIDIPCTSFLFNFSVINNK